jgi:hypothetical protein
MPLSNHEEAEERAMHSKERSIETHAASRKSNDANPTASRIREGLRKRYLPDPVRILFVGESPPASGRFFYQADSGLYRAVRDTFVTAFPSLQESEFLDSFRSLGCYLVDLCSQPVDHMNRNAREYACHTGEVLLERTIRELHPKMMVTIVRSIRMNVTRAQDRAGWSGRYLEVPYPGRWHHHRIEFERRLVPLLRNELRLIAR